MNTNCLAGIRCPNCGNEDRFTVQASAWLTVIDNGIEDVGATEWGADDPARCEDCGTEGTWRLFSGA